MWEGVIKQLSRRKYNLKEGRKEGVIQCYESQTWWRTEGTKGRDYHSAVRLFHDSLGTTSISSGLILDCTPLIVCEYGNWKHFLRNASLLTLARQNKTKKKKTAGQTLRRKREKKASVFFLPHPLPWSQGLPVCLICFFFLLKCSFPWFVTKEVCMLLKIRLKRKNNSFLKLLI